MTATNDCFEVHKKDGTKSPEILEETGMWLWVDVMFINNIPFIMTMSQEIHFGTAKLVNDMKKATLVTSMEQVIKAYKSRD